MCSKLNNDFLALLSACNSFVDVWKSAEAEEWSDNAKVLVFCRNLESIEAIINRIGRQIND